MLSWLLQTAVALPLGVYLAGKQRTRAVLAAVFFVPQLMSGAAIAVLWGTLFDPNFGLASVLGPLVGVPDGNFIGNPSLAFYAVLFVISWQFMPFHTLLYQGATRAIPESLYEAATMDGAGRWRQFRSITVPQLRDTIITSGVLIVVGLADVLRDRADPDQRRPRHGHPDPAAAHVRRGLPQLPDGLRRRARRGAARDRHGPLARDHPRHRLPADGQSAGGPVTATTPSTERPAAPPSTSGRPTEPVRKRSPRSVAYRRPNVAGGLGAGIWFVIVAVPLYFLAVTSFRAPRRYLDRRAAGAPVEPTARQLRHRPHVAVPALLPQQPAGDGGCVAIVIVLALPAAYAIVRSRSRLVSTGFSIVLLGLAVPAQAVIVPLYLMITQLRLYDSLLAIILPTAAFALPLSIVVLTSSLRDVAEGAVRGDHHRRGGHGPHALLRWCSRCPGPGLATIGIFTALQAWNGFLFPLVLTQNPDVRVLTLGLWDFQGQYGTNVPLVTAAVTPLPAPPAGGLPAGPPLPARGPHRGRRQVNLPDRRTSERTS